VNSNSNIEKGENEKDSLPITIKQNPKDKYLHRKPLSLSCSPLVHCQGHLVYIKEKEKMREGEELNSLKKVRTEYKERRELLHCQKPKMLQIALIL